MVKHGACEWMVNGNPDSAISNEDGPVHLKIMKQINGINGTGWMGKSFIEIKDELFIEFRMEPYNSAQSTWALTTRVFWVFFYKFVCAWEWPSSSI